MTSRSERFSRSKRVLVRPKIEEDKFCSNNSYHMDKTKRVPGRGPSFKNYSSMKNLPLKQDSFPGGSKYRIKGKPSAKDNTAESNRTVSEKTVIGQSQKSIRNEDDEDGSDSSLFFTDEISAASCSLKEHPESLSKSALLKKNSDFTQKDIKKKTVKRKELSASRKAAKKVKLNDTDEVEFIPDPVECITIDSDNFSELETSIRTEFNQPVISDCNVQIKKENFSPVRIDKIKREKSQEDEKSSKEMNSRRKNQTKSTKDLQLSENSCQVKCEPLPSSFKIEADNPVISSSNFQVKSETPDSSIDVNKIKKEKENEKATKKSTSREKLTIKGTTTRNKKIKTESEIKTEIPSTVKTEPVEISERKQRKLGAGIEWESQMLADLMDLDFFLAKNIISLFENECTIPFIARYRRESTNNMDADQLRQVKSAYEYIKSLEKKALVVLKKLESAGKLTPCLANSIQHVKSIEELDFIYAPYKQSGAKSKAEKARSLGLEEAALNVLNGKGNFLPSNYVKPQKDGIKNEEEVIQSVQHIMAEIFSKDEAVLDFIFKIENQIPIVIKSNKKKSDETDDEEGKFRIYYDFTKFVRDLLPHQILALNRGENLKILTVKMSVDESFYHKLYRFCSNRWLKYGKNDPLRNKMFDDSFKDSYTRLISPLLMRRTKAKLTRKAQETAIENFALNLKSLLQTPPIKGYPILGIDPGLRHGMKFALISSQGSVLWTTVLNFDLKDPDSYRNEQNMHNIKKQMIQHQCELIAIGNGCGSRQIETVISNYLKKGFFNPQLNVSYTFVNERGASIYSCSSIAKEEFPDLDPNLISAVFIARSLQDPLNEFVKVEPKHLGVGMYQHDMPEVKLNQSLDEVVMECVSFTGIDINTASIHLLKRVSGLGASRAANIIKWRQENGPFKNRQQLFQVNRLGQKTFEQCSGFLRIHSQTCDVQLNDSKKRGIPGNDDYNPLDSTWIHPESYNIAYLFIGHCESNTWDLGTTKFIDKIKRIVQLKGLKSIADTLAQSEQTISFIYDALIKPSNYDYRCEFSKPVFSTGLRSMENLNTGDSLQGVISNVVEFGAFVDIGVGKNGLIHNSQMNRMKVRIGDHVEVRIINIEKEAGRIGLFLEKKN